MQRYIGCGKGEWETRSGLKSACKAWILAGGAYHTCCSQHLSVECLDDFAAMAGIEFVIIGKNTDIYQFKNEWRWNDMYFQKNT